MGFVPRPGGPMKNYCGGTRPKRGNDQSKRKSAEETQRTRHEEKWEEKMERLEWGALGEGQRRGV